jgi:HNH endonuclease
MKTIALSNGEDLVMVDDCDFEWLSQWRWDLLCAEGGHRYAIHSSGPKKRRTRLRMHRLIMRCTKGTEVDHIDGNGLNNQRANLRSCTHQQNSFNNHREIDGKTSQFRGVCWNKSRNRWRPTITVNGRQRYLGLYLSEMDAAAAYDRAALELFGQFANLNFPSEATHDQNV